MNGVAAPPVSNRVAVIRAARGLSGAELARRMRISRQLVSMVETGKLAPWPAFRERAAAALGVDEELLFS